MFTCKQNQMETGKSKMIVVTTRTKSRNSQTPIFLGLTAVDKKMFSFQFNNTKDSGISTFVAFISMSPVFIYLFFTISTNNDVKPFEQAYHPPGSYSPEAPAAPQTAPVSPSPSPHSPLCSQPWLLPPTPPAGLMGSHLRSAFP